jgi:hypothetical protein
VSCAGFDERGAHEGPLGPELQSVPDACPDAVKVPGSDGVAVTVKLAPAPAPSVPAAQSTAVPDTAQPGAESTANGSCAVTRTSSTDANGATFETWSVNATGVPATPVPGACPIESASGCVMPRAPPAMLATSTVDAATSSTRRVVTVL